MRQFKLKNALGMSYDLNDKNHFLYSMSGLGQKYDTDYENIGNLYVKTEDILDQKNIRGKIRFAGYKEYQEFVLFIQHKPLVLEYTAYGTYYMDVSIDQIDKSEMGSIGMTESVRINGLTSWYKIMRAENNNDAGGGKVYPYTYPYSYKDFASGEIRIQSDSAILSPCRIILMGPCKNPSWSHYLNGSRKTTGKLGSGDKPCIIDEGKRVIIDNTGPVYSIMEYDTNGNMTRDLYSMSDFDTKRFVSLGYGENRITYQHEDSNEMNAIVEGRITYAGI